ncbi:Z-ring formation inhibitor MciZ [Paenibacillus sp. HJL G12]|uniref:Z-ring formation inhibitor MciZ n=1 Tax=Paenibacillus dendrobii TaxID=2691084 RepID=A0A7X3IJA5_9BACL|nr:Z-ring formation inhibitor MciZ [Paenibacillus dendrobii]MWV45003.1 Z-ring formation inhibitor MciZ [Paenibacillus dendrobii]
MKSYRTGNSFHMVGQAWQIKIMLKQWMKEVEPHTPLASILDGSKDNRINQDSVL